MSRYFLENFDYQNYRRKVSKHLSECNDTAWVFPCFSYGCGKPIWTEINITTRMQQLYDLKHNEKVEDGKEIMLLPTNCSCNDCKTYINITFNFSIANVISNKIFRAQELKIEICKSCIIK